MFVFVFVMGGIGAGVMGGAGVKLVACWGLRLLSNVAPFAFALASSSTGLVYIDLVRSGRVAMGGGGGSSSSSSGTFDV